MLVSIILGAYVTLILAALVITLSIKFDENHSALINSWHYKLFMALSCYEENDYKYDRPRNVCSYFWWYVLYILTIPFTIFAIVINLFFKTKIGEGKWITSVAIWLGFFVSFGVGISLVPNGSILLKILAGFALIVGCLLMIVAIAFLVMAIYKFLTRNTNKHKPKKTSLVVSRFKSWKEKNCAIINWK